MPLHERTFLGHPVGLYVLFFTEMWERFSYYGMRALLVLYLVNHLKWSTTDAATLAKFYTTLVYVTPILGGLLADRLLGNTWAVIIGAVLMALGHFFMAFEELPILYTALVLLILGNGFFKPNMSTQVGRLYPPNDGRRDAAYTIFYMGINLGAFLSPLVCGWLALNTVGGYHSGFTAAGIGMVLGLVTYLVGKPLVKEINAEEREELAEQATARHEGPLSEHDVQEVPSVLGPLNAALPILLVLGAAGCLGGAVIVWYFEMIPAGDAAILGISGICLTALAYVMAQVRNGLRDRVATILALGVFTVFFWGAFEQAATTLNLWADQSTNRYLTQEAPPGHVEPAPPKEEQADAEEVRRPEGLARFTSMFQLKPGRKAESWSAWFQQSLNPIPTEWFQSINALAIFVMAPLFAWLWVALARRGWQPSIPMKMVIGLVCMSASMAVMLGGAFGENKSTSVAWSGELPAGVEAREGVVGREVDGRFLAFHAGRLRLERGQLMVAGVLPDIVRDQIIKTSVPEPYRAFIDELTKKSQGEVELQDVPAGFDVTLNGLAAEPVSYDAARESFTLTGALSERELNSLLVAGGHPEFRSAIRELATESQRFRVSPWWLFWSYILATLGELCLSPVGLSMVSKLAPVKYGTMVMGVWLFISALGNYVAGTMGEQWGRIPPIQYFILTTVVVGVSALILLVLSRLIAKMMHGVD